VFVFFCAILNFHLFCSFSQELPQERLMIATMGMSACEWMFEETRKYVCERKAFGKTLSKLQVCHAQCT
jgi:long-chain-acyl-CoA dehydrogenase